MPDLTPVAMARCTAHIGDHEVPSSAAGKTYTVTFYDDGSVWCMCPAMKYKRNESMTCKHVDALMDRLCCWDEGVHGGSVDIAGKCPECGGETTGYLMGV